MPKFTTLDPPAPLALGGQGFFTLGMASNGIVAGYFFDSNGGSHGYLRQLDGTVTIIDAPDAIQGVGGKTTVLAVNSSGVTVGTYLGNDGNPHAFSRSATGQYSLLPGLTYAYFGQNGLPAQASTSLLFPTAINDNGVIAGYFYDPNLGIHSFIIPSEGIFNGQPLDIGGPGSGSASGQGFGTWIQYVAPTGDAVGSYRRDQSGLHGFIRHYADGTVTVLDAPGYSGTATGGTIANWIAADGTVVGSVVNSTGITHAFVRTPDGTYTIFDPPGPLTWSTASFINVGGVIAGNFTDANSVQHGYLRNPNQSFTIIDEPDGAQIPNLAGTSITGFNVAGTIVGIYQDTHGVGHAYIRQ
ncbi:MAG TPA: hypothetical protein VFI45_05110 [Candidatus Acidoferrum sp.]|nr:hypothetical protein [Candidatus Acidoferrum sp.]